MIVLLGSSHKSAPVAVRERMALPPGELPESLKRLVAMPGVEEALIVSTCNRVEILARGSDADTTLASIRRFLATERNLDAREIERYSYSHKGSAAVKHLFSVASGLDSMILGEPQITGQVKQAYLVAREQGTTGPVLDRLLQYCFSVTKRVRTETAISRNAVSVAFAAVELGRTIFGELRGRKALLVGAGKMSSLVAKHLVGKGVSDIVVTSRNYSHAAELATEAGGSAVHWDDGLAQLSEVDIVLSCTHSSHFIVSHDAIVAAVRRRRGRPLFLIDIAVPRDIDPRANELDNVYLYDIDGLQGVVDSNREDRRQASEEALHLIEREVESFERWRQSRTVTPMIVALRDGLHAMAKNEVQRVHRRHGPMSPEQSETLDDLSRSIIQKILHKPIRHLQGAMERGDVDTCERMYRDLFGVSVARHQEDSGAEAATGQDEDTRASNAGEDSADSDATSGPGPRLIRGGQDG